MHQAAVRPIGEKPIDSDTTVSIDMYTIVGYISCFTGALVFIIFLPGIFVEYATPTRRVGEKEEEEPPTPTVSPEEVKEEEAKEEVGVDTVDENGFRPVDLDAEGEDHQDGRRAVQFSSAPRAPVLTRRKVPKRDLTKQYSKASLYSGVILEIKEPEKEEEMDPDKSELPPSPPSSTTPTNIGYSDGHTHSRWRH